MMTTGVPAEKQDLVSQTAPEEKQEHSQDFDSLFDEETSEL